MAIGWLTILSEPSGAKIYVDGSYKGYANSSSTKEIPLSEGWYTIKATLMGYEDKTKEVRVTAGDYRGTTIFLGEEEEEEEEDEEGTLSVNSNPQGANVYVLNNFIGNTPVSRDMKTGRFAIRLHKAGYKDYEDDVLVEEDKISVYFYTLEEEGNWWDFLLEALLYGWKPKKDPLFRIYAELFDKELTFDEWSQFQLGAGDWLLPLNATSKLLFNSNLKGDTEQFGSANDYTDMLLGLALFIPAAKIIKVTGKLAGKAITFAEAAKIVTKFGSDDVAAGLLKAVKKHPSNGAKIIANYPAKVKDAVIEGLGKTPYGREVIYMLGKQGFWGGKTTLWKKFLKAFGFSSVIVAAVGSYPFAGFILEEALQTTDFAIRTAEDNNDLEGMEKAVAWKKELLDRTMWEKIFASLPFGNVLSELKDYYDTARIKLEIDEISLENMRLELGEADLPEILETTIRDIIDGDTIKTDIDAYEPNVITPTKLPEYQNSGKARIRIVGINSPEKSPKGEILCTDIEVYEVEKSYADESRDVLLPLNDKKVILYIDPDNTMDSYGRVLAKVVYGSQDVGLEQIRNGLACWYKRETHKYINDDLYKDETLTAKANGVGMWKAFIMADFKINITSTPDNAQLYIDGVNAHHRTPSDQEELKDVLELIQPGSHTFRAEKGGKYGEEVKTLTTGDNGTIHISVSTSIGGEVNGEDDGEGDVLFTINSTPDRGKVYIDDVYTHHLTPTDEREQRDVIHLWTAGSHKIRVVKGGYADEETVTFVRGQRKTMNFTLSGMAPEPGDDDDDGEPANCSNYISQITTLQDKVSSLQSQLSACQAGGNGEPPQPPPEECTSGEYKCVGTTRWKCVNGNWQLHEANSATCGYVAPQPEGDGKIIQSWASGDFGDDDEQGALGSALQVDMNDDGSYSTFNFHNRKSGSSKRGDKIGETLEGWEVFQKNAGQMWIYTGAIFKGFLVYYVYIKGM